MIISHKKCVIKNEKTVKNYLHNIYFISKHYKIHISKYNFEDFFFMYENVLFDNGILNPK